MADSVAEKIKNYRSVGGTKISFQKGSRVKLRKMIQSAYDNYPTEWSEKAEHRNTLKVVQRGRGFYNDGTSVIAADEQSYDAQSTMYHELGHRTEHTFPEIMRLEQEFYERRTKGEKLQKLSDLTGIDDYGTETTRTDQFKDVYMGKEYLTYSGEHYGYEILSMGLEGVYRGKYNLYDDDDYAKFILGLLLKGWWQMDNAKPMTYAELKKAYADYDKKFGKGSSLKIYPLVDPLRPDELANGRAFNELMNAVKTGIPLETIPDEIKDKIQY